jgi:hypothetical protein
MTAIAAPGTSPENLTSRRRVIAIMTGSAGNLIGWYDRRQVSAAPKVGLSGAAGILSLAHSLLPRDPTRTTTSEWHPSGAEEQC